MMLPVADHALLAECETADPERFAEAVGPSDGRDRTAITVLGIIVAVAIWAIGAVGA